MGYPSCRSMNSRYGRVCLIYRHKLLGQARRGLAVWSHPRALGPNRGYGYDACSWPTGPTELVAGFPPISWPDRTIVEAVAGLAKEQQQPARSKSLPVWQAAVGQTTAVFPSVLSFGFCRGVADAVVGTAMID